MRKSKNRLLKLGILMGTLALALAITGGVMVHAAPATSCSPADLQAGSCTDTSHLTANLNGSMLATAQDAAPVSAALTQQGPVSFNFVVTVVDTRGAGARWELGTQSIGLPITTSTSSTSITYQPLILNSVSAGCTLNSSCWSSSVGDLTLGGANPITLDSSHNQAQNFAQAPLGGDFGSIDVAVGGQFFIPPGAIGGSYNAVITVTLATHV